MTCLELILNEFLLLCVSIERERESEEERDTTDQGHVLICTVALSFEKHLSLFRCCYSTFSLSQSMKRVSVKAIHGKLFWKSKYIYEAFIVYIPACILCLHFEITLKSIL